MDTKSNNEFWDIKPLWCQPWSIISVGILILIFSWTLLGNIIVSLILAFLVAIWWLIFLFIVPASYQAASGKK